MTEAAGSDRTPPAIEILRPQSPARIGGSEVEVAGIARDDTFVGSVTVDGLPVRIDVSRPEVAFSLTVPLEPGRRDIAVTVEDVTGEVTTTTVGIERDANGPAVGFADAPAPDGTIAAFAYDPAGVTAARLDGRPLDLEAGGEGEVSFLVPQGTVRVERRLECEDGLGNITRVPVPARPIAVSVVPGPVLLASASPAPHLPTPQRTDWHRSPQRGSERQLLRTRLHRLTAATAPVPAFGLAAAPAQAPEVEFLEPLDGDVFYQDEIVVATAITGKELLRSVQVEVQPSGGVDADAPTEPFTAVLDHVPSRAAQCLSGKVRLQPGLNTITLILETVSGQTVRSTPIAVERQVTEADRLSKLNLALLGSLWEGTGQAGQGEAQRVETQFAQFMRPFRDRFTFVTRDRLDVVLSEQRLSSLLSSPEERLALNLTKSADAMAIGTVHLDTDSVELQLEVFGTETGIQLALVDVAGPATARDADRASQVVNLTKLLVLATTQEFPRVTCRVTGARGREVELDNGERHGLREGLPVVLFEERPDGEGSAKEVLYRGIIDAADADTSVAVLSPTAESPARPPRAGDLIVTK